MNTLSSRILVSHAIFITLIIVGSFFTMRYIKSVTKIRNLQSSINLANTKTLALINNDMILRTEEVKMPRFYSTTGSKLISERNSQFEALREDLMTISNLDITSKFDIRNKVNSIILHLAEYEKLHQKLLIIKKKRGFRDEGFEGLMRSYAHELEKYPNEIGLSDLLSLRRHEKDFFLRNDSLYVKKFNLKNNQISKKLSYSSDPRNTEAGILLKNYSGLFNQIVNIEEEIGTHNSGLTQEVRNNEQIIMYSFAQLSDSVNIKTESLVDQLLSQYLITAIISLFITMILGYLSAGFVTSSVKKLALSMQEAIKGNFQSPIWKPSHLSSHETKSLHKSYLNLLSTIRRQLRELEVKNTQLSSNNQELNRVNLLLESSQETLKESNAVKDKFFSIIGHDLRAPMANLTMALRLLSDDSQKLTKKETRKFVGNLLDSASAISILLDNLLQWSNTQTSLMLPRKEEVHLAAMIRNILALQSQRLEDKQIKILSIIPNNLTITADRNMIDLVIRNLIDNAIKFTPTGGKIQINSTIIESKINIHIIDNGIGISQEDQKTLFTSVVKKQSVGTKGEKGTGLGLVLAFDFIRKHGGTLSVNSFKNQGSTFTISIPITEKIKEKLSA